IFSSASRRQHLNPPVKSVNGIRVTQRTYTDAILLKINRLKSQFTTFTPRKYREPNTRSQVSIWRRNSGKYDGSCERSASICKITSYSRDSASLKPAA